MAIVTLAVIIVQDCSCVPLVFCLSFLKDYHLPSSWIKRKKKKKKRITVVTWMALYQSLPSSSLTAVVVGRCGWVYRWRLATSLLLLLVPLHYYDHNNNNICCCCCIVKGRRQMVRMREEELPVWEGQSTAVWEARGRRRRVVAKEVHIINFGDGQKYRKRRKNNHHCHKE